MYWFSLYLLVDWWFAHPICLCSGEVNWTCFWNKRRVMWPHGGGARGWGCRAGRWGCIVWGGQVGQGGGGEEGRRDGVYMNWEKRCDQIHNTHHQSKITSLLVLGCYMTKGVWYCVVSIEHFSQTKNSFKSNASTIKTALHSIPNTINCISNYCCRPFSNSVHSFLWQQVYLLWFHEE